MKKRRVIYLFLLGFIFSIVLSLSCNKEEYPMEITVKYAATGNIAVGATVIVGTNVNFNNSSSTNIEDQKQVLTTDQTGIVSHTFKLPAILTVCAYKHFSGKDTTIYSDSVGVITSIRLTKNQKVSKTILLYK